ncbi:hypothetical protein BRC81_13035 [Halobacteriales archaeon QS_1_68_20]|nr:MAG: hypothetical protein BRC81_13035 [Halobacteriales archaeon QS_1_68_20]
MGSTASSSSARTPSNSRNSSSYRLHVGFEVVDPAGFHLAESLEDALPSQRVEVFESQRGQAQSPFEVFFRRREQSALAKRVQYLLGSLVVVPEQGPPGQPGRGCTSSAGRSQPPSCGDSADSGRFDEFRTGLFGAVDDPGHREPARNF